MKKRRSLKLRTKKAGPSDSFSLEKEKCMNPWDGECERTDIALYIMHRGRRLPICRRCWNGISAKNIEWVYH
jgi:hypothetical protein